MSDYPKVTHGEPAELNMRECGRCDDLQAKLAELTATSDLAADYLRMRDQRDAAEALLAWYRKNEHGIEWSCEYIGKTR